MTTKKRKVVRARKTREPKCCKGTPVPHKASLGCRSGGKNHCTCPSCF